ncbi:hypothetical protein Ancab_030098 [Ancistrocladus abbreviatus]
MSCAPRNIPECIKQLKKKHRRATLTNTVTIDSIYEKNYMSLNSVLEAVIVDAFVLPGTNIYMLRLGDFWSSNTIDLYLHRRYYDLVSIDNGILKKGREISLTGCYLRTASEGQGYPRLLPTEYLVILLDEVTDQDDDAMLLGAQFCSDSFSSISLEAANQGGVVFIICKKKQITLVDNDGEAFKFILWGEQVVLANLLSVRSMLAIDRPFIASTTETAKETSTEVYVSMSQNRFQGSKFATTLDPTQVPKVSQVKLPCTSQGSIDFSNYPFRCFITDLHDKITGISLYGVVTDIFREADLAKTIFYMRIEDATGTIWAKLHFSESWSLGRLGIGHSVYISGLTCCLTKHRSAIFSGYLIIAIKSVEICRAWLDQCEQWHINTRLSHASCGHFVNATSSGSMECDFCHCNCEAEVRRTFHLKISIADERGKAFAWCSGQTATELLQISPDEFYELPEEEQVMYPSSLENERYMIAVVNCSRHGTRLTEDDVSWEITRAFKL